MQRLGDNLLQAVIERDLSRGVADVPAYMATKFDTENHPCTASR